MKFAATGLDSVGRSTRTEDHTHTHKSADSKEEGTTCMSGGRDREEGLLGTETTRDIKMLLVRL